MNPTTDQMSVWSSTFGKDYTDRNTFNVEELDALYKKTYGLTRTQLNTRFLDGLDRNARLLEVGCNVGNQLALLQQMGFSTLYGIELQDYAVEIAKSHTSNINIIQGSAFDIPFKDEFFDCVFTSGVLIHIHPDGLRTVMSEIERCSRRFILGLEYYAPQLTEVNYRGHNNLLWKTDYSRLYCETCPNLTVVKKERLTYLESDNVDEMFLLSKDTTSRSGEETVSQKE